MKHQLFAGIAFWAAAAAPIGVTQAQTVENDAEQAAAQLSETRVYDIGAGDLARSLDRFAEQNGFQIGYPPDLVAGKTAPALQGEYTPAQALDRLLAGSGLEAEFVNDRAIVLRRVPAASDTIGQRRPGIEEIIVTGQKREERIQDVPIAISAFSPEDLEAQKIEGGFDLLKGVPNVTFSKTNFAGYNFQIRGIGTQAVSATTDPAVAVSFNNTTLIVNRLFEQEYLDVERVEVLRGPQGTLFGRNATAGVINVISNKPEMGVWDGMIDVEVGNYNTRRLRGFFNAPIGDEWAIRGAYASTQRDGFGINEAASDDGIPAGERPKSDVDNRDLWTGRLTIGWQPTDRFRANLLWERFEEDDRRVRTSKQLCHRHDGEQVIGDFNWDDYPQGAALGDLNKQFQTSTGCQAGSLYSDNAYGTPNGVSLPFIGGMFLATSFFGTGYGLSPFLGSAFGFPEPRCDVEAEEFPLIMFPINVCQPDPYANPETGSGTLQSRDLRTIYSKIDPKYQAEADIVSFSFDYELSDSLVLTSETVYVDDSYYATQDFNRFTTFPVIEDSSAALDPFNPFSGEPPFDGFYADISPRPEGTPLGTPGVFCDPQLGCSNSLVAQDLVQAESRQYNQEFQLSSSFDAPWNFSLGANYTRFRTNVDYFVFANALTLFTYQAPFDSHSSRCVEDGLACTYVDPNPLESINGEGHNYFRSANPYKLTSAALFGELYWNATETVKFTAGLRFTWDRKVFSPIPSQLLLRDYREIATSIFGGGGPPSYEPGDSPEECLTYGSFQVLCPLSGSAPGGRGYPANPDIVQEWFEPTGRLVVDWQPLLDFTDETLVYASFSHGYKGGGANPPTISAPAGLYITGVDPEALSHIDNPDNFGGALPPTTARRGATFEPEFVNAYELGTKNTLFGGALVLNMTGFYYNYSDYQVSKIVDRSAVNENFDAEVWGLELESIFAPSLNWQFNAAIGFLQTKVGEGEKSIDIMDRVQGGNQSFTTPDGVTYDEWIVVKPFPTFSSNCVAPVALVEQLILDTGGGAFTSSLCPGGGFNGTNARFFGLDYDPHTDAPNGTAGFFADLSGNEMPNSPEFTVALGGQYNFDLTSEWRATARVDYYWQDKSYARIYNTEYDRLKSWSNTNLSFWVNSPQWGVTVEAYVKNVFDETPLTGTFTNSDDSGLTTNVFTLDPRLIGVSIRKEF